MIKTDGGTYVDGNVSTGGGKFIGRDEVHNYYGSFYSRLNYRSDITGILDFYTKIFVGRLNEWRYIADFASLKLPGYMLVEALPGYGKSALMAHLVHRQETGQWEQLPIPILLYFFIRHEGRRNTPIAFLQALNSQLLNLLNGEGGIPSDLLSLHNQFSHLWPQAVAAATAEHPLLLLIDGLDEMAAGEVTIADELPALREVDAFVHIVVSSRPNPQSLEQVAIDHPFRKATIYTLQSFTVPEVQELLQENDLPISKATMLAPRVRAITKGEPLFARFVSYEVAKHGETVLAHLEVDPPVDVEAYFRQQFRQLDELAQGELIWQILGLLTATLGGIIVEEIAEVLQMGNRPVRKAIRLLQRFLLSDQKVELMHLQLRKVIIQEIGKREELVYRQKLLEWCQLYQHQGWPMETPEYILHYYAQHLANEKQRDVLYHLIDQRWMQLKRAHTFSHRAFAEDVTLAIAAAEQSDNWVQLVRNCLLYASLKTLATNVPVKLLGILALLGQTERALDYTALIQNHTQQSEAYCHMAEILLGRGEIIEGKILLGRALDVSGAIIDKQAKAKVCRGIIQALTQASDIEQALDIAKHIHDQNIKENALCTITQSLAQTGKIEQALNVAESINNQNVKEKALCTIAQVLAQTGKIEQALDIAKYIHDQNVKANALCTIAQALARAGEIEHILKIAKYVTDKNAKVNVLCAIVQALTQAGDIEQARSIIKHAIDIADGIPNNHKIRVIAESNIAQAMIQVGDIDLASASIEHIGLTISKYSTNIRNRVAFKHFVQALKALASTHKWIRAIFLAEYITDKKIKANALADITQALIQAGKVERTLSIALDITDEKIRADAVSEIVQVLTQTGKTEQALKVANYVTGEEAKEKALCTITQVLAQTGKIDQALNVAESINNQNVKEKALCTIAQVLAQAGKIDQAKSVTEYALRVTENITSEEAKENALCTITQVLAQAGKIDQALNVAESINNQNIKENALCTIAQALAQAGKIDQALNVAESINNQNVKEKALCTIAQVLAQAGKIDQVLSVVERIPSEGYSQGDKEEAILNRIAQFLVQAGKIDQALDIASLIPPKLAKVSTFSHIAQVLAQAGRIDQAKDIISYARRIRENITSKAAKEDALFYIAQALAAVGETNQALGLTECILSEWNKAVTFRAIALVLAESGKKEQALDVAEHILDEEIKANTLEGIALALVVVAGKREDALDVAKNTTVKGTNTNPVWSLALTLATSAGAREKALDVAENTTAEGINATALNRFAQVLTPIGQDEKIRQQFKQRLLATYPIKRQAIFEELERSAQALFAIDQGETLWQVYEAIRDMESWWD